MSMDQNEIDRLGAIMAANSKLIMTPPDAEGQTPETDALMNSRLVMDMQRGWKAALVEHARSLERRLAKATAERDLIYKAKDLAIQHQYEMREKAEAALASAASRERERAANVCDEVRRGEVVSKHISADACTAARDTAYKCASAIRTPEPLWKERSMKPRGIAEETLCEVITIARNKTAEAAIAHLEQALLAYGESVRESCAKVCEEVQEEVEGTELRPGSAAKRCKDAIRALKDLSGKDGKG